MFLVPADGVPLHRRRGSGTPSLRICVPIPAILGAGPLPVSQEAWKIADPRRHKLVSGGPHDDLIGTTSIETPISTSQHRCQLRHHRKKPFFLICIGTDIGSSGSSCYHVGIATSNSMLRAHFSARSRALCCDMPLSIHRHEPPSYGIKTKTNGPLKLLRPRLTYTD